MVDSIKSHHGKDFEYINRYNGVEKDDAYKSIAINNIKTHPGKYVMNWFSNLGRLLFNYPYSYTYQKPTTLVRIPLNGIIVVFIIFCLYPTIVNWRKIPFAIRPQRGPGGRRCRQRGFDRHTRYRWEQSFGLSQPRRLSVVVLTLLVLLFPFCHMQG